MYMCVSLSRSLSRASAWTEKETSNFLKALAQVSLSRSLSLSLSDSRSLGWGGFL